MTKKVSRIKKILRVMKRKLTKPVIWAGVLSLIIYLVVGSIELGKREFNQTPRFLITRISDTFEPTEYTHLLLTVQEIRRLPKEESELIEFVNGPFPGKCPTLLERQFNRMNWEPQAFLSRAKKIFAMYEEYDRVKRLDETVSFLAGEIDIKRLPPELKTQVDLLRREREAIIGRDITEEEYQFVKEYEGLILRLKKQEIQQSAV